MSWSGDAQALEADLRRAVRGEVRFDAGSRALHATDASNYRQVPIGVVVPKGPDDVAVAVEVCRTHGAPVLGRGGGTSLAGQACNVAVVLDFSRHLGRILEIDPGRRIARVEPGVVLDSLRREAGKHGLTFGPDPATHAWCTLGGMIGNNSCGAHSLSTGRTSDNVEELDVLTYGGLRLRVGATPDAEVDRIVRAGGRRGEIYGSLRALRDRYAGLIRERFPDIPRRVSGYNLDELLPEKGFHVARALSGTEGTCVTILEATVRLVPAPRCRALLVLGYPDVFAAADHVLELLEADPIGLEGMDRFLVENEFTRHSYRRVLDALPAGGAWLLAEFGGDTREEAASPARRLAASIPGALVIDDPAGQAAVWSVREAAVGTTSRDRRLGDAWPGWEDAAVPPARLSAYLRELRALLDRFGYGAALYGHFGEGCLHARINFDLATAEGVKRYRAFLEEAADLVAAHGGSLSGEHGDGQCRAELLPRMFGEELCRAFRDFKRIWDPDGRMNPGKVVDPLPLDTDLRLRTRLDEPETVFRFPNDDSRLSRAVTRCVGVGRCRRDGGGVMCPSWQVTREEKHSTRGRARLLFEMLSGEVISGGWQSEEVHDALDLCLSCKGCRSDCPAGVDMATYKAEFLHHHYQGRRRPVQAYALGLVHRWARLASLAPGLANLLAPALKGLAGIDRRRALPAFARQTFRSRFARRRPAHRDGPRVLLWPDTFTNHFHPEIGMAAVQVLERAGFRIEIPGRALCCGRPLYDFGMLDPARNRLREILDALRDPIREGVPVVGLEPSCVAVFRDELLQLFPDDPDARRLAAQTHTLAEWMADAELSPRSDRILVQAHCHHHAVMGLDADRQLLGRLGGDVRFLDAGCCGMAGAFGFEEGHYEVSMACAERVLLPAVREAGPDDVVLADGFSCREQIFQGTGRRALHLAQLLAKL